MGSLSIWLKKRLLAYLIKRYPTEDAIPRSGPEAAKVNCYTLFVTIPGDERSWFLEQLNGNTLRLYRKTGMGAAEQFERREEQLSNVAQNQFLVKHFYGYFESAYPSLAQWILESLTLNEMRYKLKHYALVQFYQRFSKSSRLRTDVLKALVQADLASDDVMRSRFSIFEVMQLVHGKNYLYLKGVGKMLREMNLSLDSLQGEGLVTKHGDDYSITSKALVAIESYELDRMKFEGSLSQSRRLNVLTAALIFVGLLQIPSVRRGLIWLYCWITHSCSVHFLS